MLSSYETSVKGNKPRPVSNKLSLGPAGREPEIDRAGDVVSTLDHDRLSAFESTTYASRPCSPVGTQPTLSNRLNEIQIPKVGWGIFVAIPALIATGFSVYLMFHWASGTKVVGCDGTLFNCDHVLNTKWASWFGMPVSGLAVANYAVLLTALVLAQFGTPKQRKWSWSMVIGCSFAAGAAALWFGYLQAFVLKHYCPYCLAAHGCGLILALGLLVLRPFGMKLNLQLMCVALVSVLALALGQVIAEEPQTYEVQIFQNSGKVMDDAMVPSGANEPSKEIPDIFEPPQAVDESAIIEAPEVSSSLLRINRSINQATMLFVSLTNPTLIVQDSGTTDAQETPKQESSSDQPQATEDSSKQPETRRLVSIGGGAVMLDVSVWPVAGDPQAEMVFVEMFDYNCGHCRQTHATVKKVKEILGDKVAAIALPLPLNLECNNQITQTLPAFAESCLLAKLAVAVWKTDPTKFCEFHDWMFTGDKAPTYEQARKHAESLVDPGSLQSMYDSKLPSQYIEKHVQIYSRLQKGTIPKLMFKSTSIVGLCQSPTHLIEILKRDGPLVPTAVVPQTPKIASGASTGEPQPSTPSGIAK